MIGAIAGDIIGSRFEWRNIKSKEFELFTESCKPTDDSVMTIAVGTALANVFESGEYSDERLFNEFVAQMQHFGRKYSDAGYGGGFIRWIFSDEPKPYNSYGNGAGMRVSPCAWFARSLEEAEKFAELSAVVSHSHSCGITGAAAIAAAVYLARKGRSKAQIKEYIEKNYYRLDFTLDGIRKDYEFDVSCQGSVPQAIEAFLEAESYEDGIRGAISIGGDSDTIAAMTGAICEAFFGCPDDIREKAVSRLDEYLRKAFERYEAAAKNR